MEVASIRDFLWKDTPTSPTPLTLTQLVTPNPHRNNSNLWGTFYDPDMTPGTLETFSHLILTTDLQVFFLIPVMEFGSVGSLV